MQPRTVTVAHNDGYSDLAAVYDYIVIGAGSASCVVARRLIDGSDARVLLIERARWGAASRPSMIRPLNREFRCAA